MPLNPEDVVRKTFTTVVLRRGYDEKEVDTFLEEVVAELRHLHGRVDELTAEVATLRARGSSDVASERVQREQQQVDLVRAERRELVADMAQLQARFEQTTQEADAAEQRRERAQRKVAELEQRQAELDEQVHQEQKQLEGMHAAREEVLAAQDRTAAELRTLRAAAEIQAEPLGPVEIEPTGNPQLDDLAVITAIAHRLHADHVEQGRALAERLRTTAEQEAVSVREVAQRECEQLRTCAE
ncbi:DivIVA domain-containing protein [Ornithinimicrobium sufpigmenti]|nr:DivIVA domain-containing protein [Ornithinimicrobium sp. HY008]